MATSTLEYQAILALLDESLSAKDNEHLDVLISLVKDLTTLSIKDLKQVPKQIEKEVQDSEESKSLILNSNYKLFIQSNSFLVDLIQKLDVLKPGIPSVLQAHLAQRKGIDNLQKWPDKIIKKINQCNDARETTIRARKEIQLLLTQLDHLEPILEIPALFETLLRNGHHEEAMDLQLFTQRLPIRYPNIRYLSRLASIETNSKVMLVQLLSMLRGPVKLPVSMRVIGYLKRLNYSETTLRILFLSLRNEYLSGLLSILKETQPQDYIRRWIETQREHLFDTITHYKHIFPDTPKSTIIDSQILPSFSTMAISNLLKVLSTFLNQIHDVSVLPSVCTQVMYYGITLGRIGLDFRPLVVPLFESTVERIILHLFHHAADQFSISSASVTERPNLNATGQVLLMKSIPVAVLYNQYMNAFNQLRYLPCISLYSSLLQGLKNSIAKVVHTILSVQTSYKRESEIIAWIISDALLQPVFEGFDKVLGNQKGASMLPHYESFLKDLDFLMIAGKKRMPSVVNIESQKSFDLNGINLDETLNPELGSALSSAAELNEIENLLEAGEMDVKSEAVGK